MNPFLNPINSFTFFKNYLTDMKRLKKLPAEQMKKFRDKSFKKIVKYAYKVPLYHNKYKKAGINPNNIKGIEDIEKLPFISKEDIIKNFPDKITPINYNTKKALVHCTGGTTGKPLYLYYDFSLAARSTIIGIRDVDLINLNWRKSKFAYIGEFDPNRGGSIYLNNFLSHARKFNPLSNLFYIDINNTIKEIMKQLEFFQPDTIHSNPAVLHQLAFLKNKGFGKKLNPQVLTTGGSILDKYTCEYVENIFNCPVLNIYSSVEAGGSIAFECLKKTWHINHDFYEIEAIDKNCELVVEGERGKIVLTRLWGSGTPIIRYTGMDDWIKLSKNFNCPCGLNTPYFIDGVEGRSRADIILPNGKIFSEASFCSILVSVTHKLKTYKIKQYQIIQKKIDEIEIDIVIDDELRNVGPSVDKLFESIKNVYKEMTGDKVRILVNEVKEIKSESFIKPPPVVISNVKPKDIF